MRGSTDWQALRVSCCAGDYSDFIFKLSVMISGSHASPKFSEAGPAGLRFRVVTPSRRAVRALENQDTLPVSSGGSRYAGDLEFPGKFWKSRRL